MALSAAIRRVATSATRLVAGSQHNHHLSSVSTLLRRTLIKPQMIGARMDLIRFGYQRFNFSSGAEMKGSDSELVKIIEAEIKCAEECDDYDRVEEIPEGFPFEIQDDEGKNIIKLKRRYQDEEVEVVVSMPSLVTGEEPEGNRVADDDDENGGNEESPGQSSIPLTVSVSKGDGPGLEFNCTAYPDEVIIDSMSVREVSNEDEMLAYEGPDFNDLDENLQKAFHKYLELRGITAITTNFLHEYMINKDSREYLHWLKDLKEFVEK